MNKIAVNLSNKVKSYQYNMIYTSAAYKLPIKYSA